MFPALSAGFYGGNKVKITVNDKEIFCDVNGSVDYRGLHVVVINPSDGHIISSLVFDTYISSNKLETFIATEVLDGSIIVAACKDECSKNLSQVCKKWFGDMGSRQIF